MPSDIDTAALRALAEAATPVLIHLDLMRYEHGGGRLAILRDGERKLIADFYGDGSDTEYYAAVHPAAVLSLLDQIDGLRARVAEVEGNDLSEAAWSSLTARNAELSVRVSAAETRVAELERERDAARDDALAAEADADARARHASEADHDLVAAEAQVAERDATIARLREALTPSDETKAAYIGEFDLPVADAYLDDDGELVERDRIVMVPWTTIKEIMAAIRARAALTATPAPVGDLDADLAVENAKLRGVIEVAQRALAAYIVPDSGISDAAVVNTLLGILDNGDLVAWMRDRAALSGTHEEAAGP